MIADFIEEYNNSVSQELCGRLVEWFNSCSDKNFTCNNIPLPDGTKKRSVRSDEQLTVAPAVSSLALPDDICNALWDTLDTCFNEYIEKYDLNERSMSCFTFKLHKVKEGQGYHVWHYETDVLLGRNRMLAWMTYLKVPEEGGETEFLYQSKRIEPVVGKTLIWPAYFTHLHRGNPPLKGEKVYVTGWFERA